MTTKYDYKMKNHLPTISSSLSVGFPLNLVQMSIVKIVDAELKTEVREDMRAAIITANIRPRAPVNIPMFAHLVPSSRL